MTDKTPPTAHAEITAPISADLRGIEQEAQELPEPSATAGMNLGQRILHVGGRENEAGYIEFGSVAAVRALVGQVLRDLQPAQPVRECLQQSATVRDAAAEKPEAGRYVLAWMEGKAIPIRAMWVPQFFLEMADDDAESGEYCEAKDQYFCPKGWYENNAHEETHWNVDRPVIAWMELPRLDAALQAAPPAPQGLITQQVEDALLDSGLPADMREEIMTDVTAPAAVAVPEGWTACRIEHEPGYPEDVAFGPQIMMDRLKKWLDRHFAALAAAPAQAVAVPSDTEAFLAAVSALPTVRTTEFDGEEADGTPRSWRNRPFVSLRALERLVRDRAAGPAQEHATQLAGGAVAYLDLGAGGYLDIGTDLSDEQLSKLPKGRHMLVIGGTYGVDGYAAAPGERQKESDAAQLLKKYRKLCLEIGRGDSYHIARIDAAIAAAPAQAQEDAREAERLQIVLFSMVDQLEGKTRPTSGNAPYHGHSTPGVWDSDNGAKAGTKCAWCELWAKAVAMRDAARAVQGGA